MNDPVVMLVLGIGGTLIVGLIGLVLTLLLRKDDRSAAAVDQVQGQSVGSMIEIARVLVRIEALEREAKKCDELAERTARLEAFEAMAKLQLDQVAEGLRAIVRMNEQIKTLYRLVEDAIKARGQSPALA